MAFMIAADMGERLARPCGTFWCIVSAAIACSLGSGEFFDTK